MKQMMFDGQIEVKAKESLSFCKINRINLCILTIVLYLCSQVLKERHE